MLRFPLSRPSTRGRGSGGLRSVSSPGRGRCFSRSCISASTTWSMHSTVLSTWRWRLCWSSLSSGGEHDASCLPDLPHDGAGELVGVVVRRHLHVDHVSGDESHLGMARDVDRPEYHRGLTAGRRVCV